MKEFVDQSKPSQYNIPRESLQTIIAPACDKPTSVFLKSIDRELFSIEARLDHDIDLIYSTSP